MVMVGYNILCTDSINVVAGRRISVWQSMKSNCFSLFFGFFGEDSGVGGGGRCWNIMLLCRVPVRGVSQDCENGTND